MTVRSPAIVIVPLVAAALLLPACVRERAAGSTADSSSSVAPLPELTDSSAFAAVATSSGGFACGLTLGGVLWCWGENRSGQLGSGSNDRYPHPVPARLPGGPWTAVAVGLRHACALSATGDAWCWGANVDSQVGAVPRDTCVEGGYRDPCVSRPASVSGGHVFRALAAGSQHTCGLDTAGVAWCWGGNRFQTYSALGTGDRAECRVTVRGEGGGYSETMPCGSLVPVRVAGPPPLTAITAAAGHTCGLAADGVAWCWGANHYGQLGVGSTERVDTAVRADTSVRFRQLAALPAATCGLDGSGGLWCWGNTEYGTIGLDSAPDTCLVPPEPDAEAEARGCALRPVDVATERPLRELATGGGSCAIAEGWTLWCWPGGGQFPAPGFGPGTASSAPRQLWPGRRFRAVGSGGGFTCGVTDDGRVMCWGWNHSGQLGNPAILERSDTLVAVARPRR